MLLPASSVICSHVVCVNSRVRSVCTGCTIDDAKLNVIATGENEAQVHSAAETRTERFFTVYKTNKRDLKMLGKCVSAQGSNDDISIIHARNLPQVCNLYNSKEK